MLTITGAARILLDAGTERDGDLVIAGGQVTAGAPTPNPPGDRARGDVLDADGGIVTPGLVNAHHHLLQCAFRTGPGTRGVPMPDWLAAMNAAYAAIGVDAELAAAAASVGLA